MGIYASQPYGSPPSGNSNLSKKSKWQQYCNVQFLVSKLSPSRASRWKEMEQFNWKLVIKLSLTEENPEEWFIDKRSKTLCSAIWSEKSCLDVEWKLPHPAPAFFRFLYDFVSFGLPVGVNVSPPLHLGWCPYPKRKCRFHHANTTTTPLSHQTHPNRQSPMVLPPTTNRLDHQKLASGWWQSSHCHFVELVCVFCLHLKKNKHSYSQFSASLHCSSGYPWGGLANPFYWIKY